MKQPEVRRVEISQNNYNVIANAALSAAGNVHGSGVSVVDPLTVFVPTIVPVRNGSQTVVSVKVEIIPEGA